MKKIWMLVFICAAVLGLASCSAAEGTADQPEQVQNEESEPAGEKGSETEETVGMANPWHDITEEEADGMIDKLFRAPEGAENVKWSVMGEKEAGDTSLPGPMVQMTFDLDGNSFTARAQYTGDEMSDISGMYYEWDDSGDVTLANWADGAMQGKTFRHVGDDGYADLCIWYDVETGASYSLGVTAPDLDGFDIQAVAEAIYAPEKQWKE